MFDCVIQDTQFRLDEYYFFEDVYLMTVNVQRVTRGALREINEFIRGRAELCNWADFHLGIACYKKPNLRTNEVETFAVIGLFVRDF